MGMLSALAALAAGASLALNLASEPQALARTVEVRADKEWTNTGVVAQDGQPIDIAYESGSWSPWPGLSVDARGCADCVADSNDPALLAPAPLGGLIGLIGDGRPFFVGARTTQIPTTSGILYLRMNDQGLFDNAGAITVRIQSQR